MLLFTRNSKKLSQERTIVYSIMHIKTRYIPLNLDVVRKKRSDDKKNKMLFPLVLRYFQSYSFARKKKVIGTEALLVRLVRLGSSLTSVGRDRNVG